MTEEKYQLLRRRTFDKGAVWESCTKGDLDFIFAVLKMNLTEPLLKGYEYKVQRHIKKREIKDV